jgi:hypothetical protein
VYNKEFVQNEIKNIEKFLEIPHFHWSDFPTRKGWSIRRRFIEKILRLPFTFKYSVLRNPIIVKDELHNLLFTLLGDDMIQEILVDGKQPVWVARQLKKSLRDRGFSIKKVKNVDDVDEPTIRLADALANVVRLYQDNPSALAVELFRLVMKKNTS